VDLLQDCGEEWANFDAVRGFQGISTSIRIFADKGEWSKVAGVFNCLLSLLKEQTLTTLSAIQTQSFVVALVEATFDDPEKNRLVFSLGVDVISRIVASMEQPSESQAPRLNEELDSIRKYLAGYAADFAVRFHAAEKYNEWDPEALKPDSEQRILLQAFPVLWEGLIEYVIPVFFWNPPFSADFNSAFLERVKAMPREKLLDFAPKVIAAFREDSIVVPGSAAVQNSKVRVIAANPHPARLAEYLATFAHPPEGECENWAPLSTIVAWRLIPYLACVTKGRELSPEQRPYHN
jgi:hypothetical protein